MISLVVEEGTFDKLADKLKGAIMASKRFHTVGTAGAVIHQPSWRERDSKGMAEAMMELSNREFEETEDHEEMIDDEDNCMREGE